MSKKLWTELRSFAETTSVRGIPRVMKAKTKVTFVVWMVAVLTCASLLVWQLSVVLTKYFQYPVSTLTVQAPAWQNPTFPDITICNLDPAIYNDANVNEFDSNANVLSASLNQSFSFTPNESPIVNAYYSDWSHAMWFPFNISAAWDTSYCKCFTLSPPMNAERDIIRVFYAILYVDQVTGGPKNFSSIYYSYDSDITGLSVSVHAAGTAPDMSFGVNIGPSTETNIQLTQSLRSRLGPPYSNCTNQQHLTGDNTSDVYTQQYCVNTCIQQKVVDQCGCVSNYVPQYTMAQLREVNFQSCDVWMLGNGNKSETINLCVTNIVSPNTTAACSAACVLPCSEFQYDAIPNVVSWPRASLLMEYSNEYLSVPRFLPFFNISGNATDEEIYNATTTKAAIDFFKSRILELKVYFGSQSFVELKDVAAFTVDTMGAQIGGVLSLWLGVTVMFAFEAFEFLYIYLTNFCKKEPTLIGPTSTAPSAETELAQSVVVQIE